MKQRYYYILFAFVLLFVGCGAERSPRSAAKHFYESIAEGEYDKALSITTLADDADPEIYYAIMEKVSLSIAERGGIESIDVVQEHISESGVNAKVVTLITYANNVEQEEVCDVVMVDEKWRVDVNLDSK